jgi:hypothetical protein
MPVPYLACMLATAHFYALPPRVLPTIQSVEGGRPGLVRSNTDGSADLGLMQINTLWLASIAGVTRQPPAVVARRLIADPCFSIAAAGAILKAYIGECHGQLLLAIGDYHSHTPLLNRSYQARVMAQAARLFGPG